MFSALVCSLQFATAATSFAEDPVTPTTPPNTVVENGIFYGDKQDSTGTATGFNGAPDPTNHGTEFSQVYGGYAGANGEDSATNNQVTLTSTYKVNDQIVGGYAGGDSVGKAEATSNTVQVEDNFNFTGKIIGGDIKIGIGQKDSKAAENTVNICGSTIKNSEIYGARFTGNNSTAKSGLKLDLSKNTVMVNRTSGSAATVTDSTIYGSAIRLAKDGGSGVNALADENIININFDDETASKGNTLYGGFIELTNPTTDNAASASKASINLRNGAYKDIYGGYISIDLADGDTLEDKDSRGGTATASENGISSDNTRQGSLTNVTADSFTGGYASVLSGQATASKNNFSLDKGSFGTVIGGKAVVKSGMHPKSSSQPGDSATASENTLTFNEVAVTGEIYGGYASASKSISKAEADGNTLELWGGSYTGANIYAGYSVVSTDAKNVTATASNNTVSIASGPDSAPSFGANTVIWGGYTEGTGAQTPSNNTLQLFGANALKIKAGNIKNFDKLSFDLGTVNAGDHVLTLSGGAKKEKTVLANAEVNVTINKLVGSTGGEFQVGDKVYLLTNNNGVTADIKSQKVEAKTGISLKYTLAVQKDANNVYLAIDEEAGKKGGELQPETKTIAEGAAAGLALVNESANTAIELARTFAPQTGIVAPFVHVQGSSVQHETGSHVNLSSVSLVAGIGTGIETGAGKLSVGAFFEYGKGNYSTENSYDNRADVNGDGDAWYMGGGILAKMDFAPTGPGHFYVEGSAHMGQLHNEFDSTSLTSGFDMDSPYYSLHGGLGYVWNMAEGHDLDVYGKYIWTRVQGTDDTLTTGDKYEYDDMDSSRVRLGARYTYNGNDHIKPYIGAAWEHEFAGSCDSTVFGHSVAAPSLEGDSGIGEIGITMVPSTSLPLSIGLGVQGYVGQKQGVSGNCMVKYEF